MLILAFLAAASGATVEQVEARLAEVQKYREMRLAAGAPKLSSAEVKKAAQGYLVTGLVDVPDQAADKAYGAKLMNIPIAQLWAGLNDETRHPGWTAVSYSELLEGQVCKSPRKVLQYLPVPMLADRWWIGILRENPDLSRESGGSVRELTFKSSVDPAEVTTASGKKIIAEAEPIGFAKGGWFLVAIDERSTWVEYYSWSDPGAGIPSSMASSLATRGVASTFDAMERFAKEGKPACPVK
jgi:hypothetical protein